jgi:hypothetical protein
MERASLSRLELAEVKALVESVRVCARCFRVLEDKRDRFLKCFKCQQLTCENCECFCSEPPYRLPFPHR